MGMMRLDEWNHTGDIAMDNTHTILPRSSKNIMANTWPSTVMTVVNVSDHHPATFRRVHVVAVMTVDCVSESMKLDEAGGKLMSQIMW